jgi:hypothetical protein
MAGAIASIAHADDAAKLTPHTAEYKVKISVLSGKLRTRLESTDQGYLATHVISPSGLAKLVTSGTIEESSGFSSEANGVLPLHYISSDTVSKEKTRANLVFDWPSDTISGTVNEEQVSHALGGLAHDRVSIQYELMHDLLTGSASDTYRMFDIDEMKVLTITNVGTREVRVPAGRFEAVGVRHQAEGSSRITTLWCVAELDYLPVIIEQHRKGKLRLRAVLRKYHPEQTDEAA